MDNEKYLPTILDNQIDQYLATFGAVCIEGAKWCGKTWTSMYHCKSRIMLGDPKGNFQNRNLAQIDPELVLKGDNPRLIDEWQEVPAIWDAVRSTVDQRNEKGLFILTGSATPNHKGILHSGAGRIAKLRMRPMSLFESGDSSGQVSLQDLCQHKFTPAMNNEISLKKIIDLVVRGGWPSNIGLETPKAALVPETYLKSIIDDDIYRIDGIKRDTNKMNLLLRSLARNECTTATNKVLLNDIKAIDDEDLDSNTLATYLDILKRLFITDNQPPFSSNIRSSVRVKQAEKRHLADPSLACSLLKLNSESLLTNLETLGFLFESLCQRDLRIYAESFGANLYHYQDYSNKEIDAVVELPDGDWCAFEIKLGASQIDSAAKGLIKIREEIAREKNGKPPILLGVICGLSNAAYCRDDGVYVIPINMLKN